MSMRLPMSRLKRSLRSVLKGEKTAALSWRRASRDAAGTSPYDGKLEAYRGDQFTGWCWDSRRPNHAETVELAVDGVRYRVRADLFRADLKKHRKGKGYHGFSFTLPAPLVAGRVYEVRAFIAGTKFELKGSPMHLDLTSDAHQGVLLGVTPGGVIMGWAALTDQPNLPAPLEVHVDGHYVGRTLADLFDSTLERVNARNGHCAFEYQLPLHFLDGAEHEVSVCFAGSGVPLDASPQRFRAQPTDEARVEAEAPSSAQALSVEVAPRAPFPFVPVVREVQWVSRRVPLFFRWAERAFAESDDAMRVRNAVDADEETLRRLRPVFEQMENGPLVSIIMPTWNRAYIIGEAIRSVLEQSYRHWELWVCDDGSTDNTRAVIESFADERIHYLQLAKANGAVARNFGLRSARGELIAYLDSDNLWHPDYLAASVHAFASNPAVLATFSGYLDAEIQGARLAVCEPKLSHFLYANLLNRNYIDLNGLVHVRELVERFGGFSEDLPRLQDWDLVLRYLAYVRPLAIPMHLVFYRRNLAWDQVTSAFLHRAELRQMVQRRAMGALKDSSLLRGQPSGGARPTVHVVVTDARPATLLEAAGLAEQLGALTRATLYHAQSAMLDAELCAKVGQEPEAFLPWERAEVRSDDIVLPVGKGAVDPRGGRLILPDRGELGSDCVGVRSAVVEPLFSEGPGGPRYEVPFRGPGLEAETTSARGLAELFDGDADLRVAVRVGPSVFEALAPESDVQAFDVQWVFVDCASLRVRGHGGPTYQVSAADIVHLQHQVDVWVDWEARDEVEGVDVFTVQAMLAGCALFTCVLSPQHPLVVGGTARHVVARQWRQLAALFEAVDKEGEGAFLKVRARVFALTSFSEAAIRFKLDAFLAQVAKGSTRIRDTAPAAVRGGQRRSSANLPRAKWDDGMLFVLEGTASRGWRRRRRERRSSVSLSESEV